VPTPLQETHMRWIRLLPLALILTAALQGCSSSAASRPGVLRLAVIRASAIPDPARASGVEQFFLASLLYSGLVRFGPDLHVIPDLAVSIPTISGDGSSYTFTVRRDARFSDGTRCTARDVAFSLARALMPSTHSTLARRYLGEIRGAGAVESGTQRSLAGVQVLNRLTLRIRLSHPDANFLEKLAFPTSFVLEPHLARSLDPAPGMSPGTGPWAVGGRGRDGSLILVPRRHYYGGPLQLKSLVLVPARTSVAALDLYKKGAVDASYVSGPSYRTWASRSDFHSAAGLTAYYALPGGADVGALDAVNRTLLVTPFHGALTPLNSIVPPAVPDYVPATVPDNGPTGGRAPAIQVPRRSDSVLRRLGAGLKAAATGSGADPAESATVIERTYLLPVPAVWLSMVSTLTASHWFKRRLAETSSLTNDPVSRMDVYGVLEQWALKRHLVVPLASSTVGYVVKPSVSGLQVTALGLMPDNGTWNTVQVG
jgi:ABC-type oligopeptide transport system substrate-binding subunit